MKEFKGIRMMSPMNTCALNKGVVLIGIGTLTFGSVTLITQNELEGSSGFILNQKLDFSLPQIIEDLNGEGEDIPVYKGGNDGTNLLHVLHTGQYGGDDVGGIVHWGGEYQPIMESIKEHALNPQEVKFLAGNQYWAGGELEHQIEQGMYLCMEPTPASIFTPKNTFKYFLKKTGMYGLMLLMNQTVEAKEN